MLRLRCVVAAMMVAGTVAEAACAQDFVLRPVIDTRLRYEHVDAANLPKDAEAVTWRTRSGLEVQRGDFAVLGEVEATLAIVDRYNNGGRKDPTRPSVLDPQTIGLNRFQVQYRGVPGTTVTLGRQEIRIDDDRFIGSSPWRQNEVTFDAIRVQSKPLPGLSLDASYAWKIKTIFGDEGTFPFPGTINGQNILLNAALNTPVGVVSGFGYLLAQDDRRYLSGLAKTQTYGTSLVGKQSLGQDLSAGYRLVYARQSEWKDNPVARVAEYYTGETTLGWKGASATLGYEVRGIGTGRPLTSYLAIFSSAHAFVGFADLFNPTPTEGVRDLYAGTGYAVGQTGPFDRIEAQVTHRRFRSDLDNALYGTEWDMVAVARFGRYAALAKYANYQARSFQVDTRKFWLSLEWQY